MSTARGGGASRGGGAGKGGPGSSRGPSSGGKRGGSRSAGAAGAAGRSKSGAGKDAVRGAVKGGAHGAGDAGKPGARKPGGGKPGSGKSSGGKSGAGKPGSGKAGAGSGGKSTRGGAGNRGRGAGKSSAGPGGASRAGGGGSGGRPRRDRHGRTTHGKPESAGGSQGESAQSRRGSQGSAGKTRASMSGAKPEGARSDPRRGARLKGLDRVLSRAGLCSRAEAALFVAEGRVRVNGRLAKEAEIRIDEERDEVTLDDRPVTRAEVVALLLNKPADCITTRSDERGRRTVYDLLQDLVTWVVPVGRLDRATTGLLLLTNDTRLADSVTEPRTHLPKTYRALVRGRLSDETLQRLRDGVELSDGPTRPAQIKRLRDWHGGCLLEIVITEGRNRQVRRMLLAVGSRVRFLKRVAIGPLKLSGLARGCWRNLEPNELSGLQRALSQRPAKGPHRRD